MKGRKIMTVYERMYISKIKAMKENNKERRSILSWLIDACQKAVKAATKDGVTPAPTDELCLPALRKCQKTVQEMIATCPSSRDDLLKEYQAQLDCINEYVPQAITDPEAIRELIVASGFDVKDKRNLMPYLKGCNVDMKTAQSVLKSM